MVTETATSESILRSSIFNASLSRLCSKHCRSYAAFDENAKMGSGVAIILGEALACRVRRVAKHSGYALLNFRISWSRTQVTTTKRLEKDVTCDESFVIHSHQIQQLLLLHIQCILTMCIDVQKQLFFLSTYFAHIQRQVMMMMPMMVTGWPRIFETVG
jgi:hypothetical protein